jgi:hypothetical protein
VGPSARNRDRLRRTAHLCLEVIVFLGRTVRAPQVRRTDAASKSKIAHTVQIKHRDEVEAPFTDWLREAYDYSEAVAAKPVGAKSVRTGQASSNKASSKTASVRKARAKRASAKKHRPS